MSIHDEGIEGLGKLKALAKAIKKPVKAVVKKVPIKSKTISKAVKKATDVKKVTKATTAALKSDFAKRGAVALTTGGMSESLKFAKENPELTKMGVQAGAAIATGGMSLPVTGMPGMDAGGGLFNMFGGNKTVSESSEEAQVPFAPGMAQSQEQESPAASRYVSSSGGGGGWGGSFFAPSAEAAEEETGDETETAQGGKNAGLSKGMMAGIAAVGVLIIGFFVVKSKN